MDYIDQLIFEANSALAALEPGGALIFPSTVMKSSPEDMVASPQGLRHTLRIMLAAAGAAVLLMGTAYAASVLGWIPGWDSDNFWFSQAEEMDMLEPPSPREDFGSVEEALAYYGAPEDMLPTYVPEGYALIEFYCFADELSAIFGISYQNGDNYISFDYLLAIAGDTVTGHTKDEDAPEIYTFHGVEHYVMTNVGKYKAIWQRGRFQCSISGFESREELIKTINSMYTEDIS